MRNGDAKDGTMEGGLFGFAIHERTVLQWLDKR